MHMRLTSADGSPPPARRALLTALRPRPHQRFTSACAESTPTAPPSRPPSTVHLRLRGEHRRGPRCLRRAGGSPPPARRAHEADDDATGHVRCTSACAESTWERPAWRRTRPVHLRLRGEHDMSAQLEALHTGSPPPARRARLGHAPGSLGRRFTSACAESTRTPAGTATPSTVHLRLRGEHAPWARERPSGSGSPPPARRAHRRRQDPGQRARFTSACAESTRLRGKRLRGRPVHLRLRGEHARHPAVPRLRAGSPPPARRAPASSGSQADRGRFTSACAESTSPRHLRPAATPVHLRLRGEHPSERRVGCLMAGSPPPARRAQDR